MITDSMGFFLNLPLLMVEYTDYSAAGRPATVPSPALRLPPSTPLLGHLLLLLLALPSPL